MHFSWSFRVLWGVLKKIWLERYIYVFLSKPKNKKNKWIEWKIFQGCFKNKKEIFYINSMKGLHLFFRFKLRQLQCHTTKFEVLFSRFHLFLCMECYTAQCNSCEFESFTKERKKESFSLSSRATKPLFFICFCISVKEDKSYWKNDANEHWLP